METTTESVSDLKGDWIIPSTMEKRLDVPIEAKMEKGADSYLMSTVELSIVIPLFNSEHTLENVVKQIHQVCGGICHELILVDDGSSDQTYVVASRLTTASQNRVRLVQLARNFGEHHAVLAGLAQSKGAYVAILDDDGQNPPCEMIRMLHHLQRENVDVVYGRYIERKHSWYRRLGSSMNDRMATVLLGKPRGLYLSSFKVMNRFLVDEILKYRGSYPYVDGLICQITTRLSQLDVLHHERISGKSGYTFQKLIRLGLNMSLGFSILPLRIIICLGFLTSLASVFWLVAIFIDRLWINPHVTLGIPTVLASMALFAGVQFIMLGMIGEYVGRIFLSNNGQPLYVIRSQRNHEGQDDLR